MAKQEPNRLKRGKAFHKIVQKDWHQTAQGRIRSELTIMKPAGRKGRIDVHADSGGDGPVAVVEIKATNWDCMTDIAVPRNVKRQSRQIWDYIESQLSRGRTVSPGIIFPARPRDIKRLRQIERLFEAEGIAVVWSNESIEECKARKEASETDTALD
ncbi:MAG TPA: hypothetical protein PK802_07315 [Candidatus Cloacimonadota bacterium]|jgi:hypothetical protein|nr:hypothetical protein [Candidatus Cloacimonadota bacterium]